jgi:hypothetical protein
MPEKISGESKGPSQGERIELIIDIDLPPETVDLIVREAQRFSRLEKLYMDRVFPIPLDIPTRVLRRLFTLHPHGLNLTETEARYIGASEWLELTEAWLRNWVEETARLIGRRTVPRHKPMQRGRLGAPPKQMTALILAAYKKRGEPWPVDSATLGAIAIEVDDQYKASTTAPAVRRRIQERIRQCIKAWRNNAR